MRTIWAVAAATLGLLGGCGAESGRFLILQNQAPQAPCKITTDRMIYRGSGTLDAALVGKDQRFGYELFPLLQNSFPASGASDAPEPNRLFVRAFRVRVEAGDGAPQKVFDLFGKLQGDPLIEYQEPWSGTVDPGGGLMAAAVGVVPAELARRIQASGALAGVPSIPLLTHVRAVGVRREGEVESDEFTFPVEVCDQCLIAQLLPCPYDAVNLGNACNISQDAFVDCCMAGAELSCPARK
jgi:hypothetical protein